MFGNLIKNGILFFSEYFVQFMRKLTIDIIFTHFLDFHSYFVTISSKCSTTQLNLTLILEFVAQNHSSGDMTEIY